MDRNAIMLYDTSSLMVALRKESVDRNTQRRDFKALGLLVALRKESVDRNVSAFDVLAVSALVALRKESVDRNIKTSFLFRPPKSRSPQGERG